MALKFNKCCFLDTLIAIDQLESYTTLKWQST